MVFSIGRQKSRRRGTAIQLKTWKFSVKENLPVYKAHGIKTEIMGASFRSVDQVLGLAGCDLLTVAPNLLAALEQDTRELKPNCQQVILCQRQLHLTYLVKLSLGIKLNMT